MKTINTLTDRALDAAQELELIKAPASFRKRFTVERGNTGAQAYGGVTNSGAPFVRFGRYWFDWNGQQSGTLTEYARIADDPEIGSLWSADPDAAPLALACHELAHAIVYWNWRKARRRDKRPAPHGGEWRRTYRALRRHFGLIQQNQEAA